MSRLRTTASQRSHTSNELETFSPGKHLFSCELTRVVNNNSARVKLISFDPWAS